MRGWAEVVDARHLIVMPGLVDTHRHLWQSALRNIACDWTLGQYFTRMRGTLGGVFRPEDIFAATWLGMVEALSSGITTVVDWSHNLSTPDRDRRCDSSLAPRDAGFHVLVRSPEAYSCTRPREGASVAPWRRPA